MLIQKFLDYLKMEKNYSSLTIKAYGDDLIDFQKFYSQVNSSVDLIHVRRADVRNYLMFLSEHGYSERSINRKISSLKSFYKFLLKIGEVKFSPMNGVVGLKQKNKIQIPFSIDEMNQLFNSDGVFPDSFEGRRDALVIELLYQTGIRRAELIQLKVNDIDFAQNQIKILGKRNKERLLPIGDDLRDKLSNYLEERALRFSSTNDYLFLTSKGKAFYDKLVYKIVNTYLSLVSTKSKKSPHMLRHSFATHMLNQGADLSAVKELLGHSSLVSTQIYTHSSIEQLKKVFNHAHPRSEK